MMDVSRSNVLFIAAIYILVHFGIALFVQANPDAFLSGDRSRSRLEKIDFTMNNVTSESQLPELYNHPIYADAMEHSSILTSSLQRMLILGPPGDYLLHGIMYNSLGLLGVAFFQLIIGFLSIICIFHLAQQLGMSTNIAAFVAISILMTPINLSTPHQLTTEGMFNPLVIIALWSLVTDRGHGRILIFLVGLISITLASALRIQFTLYPIVLSIIYIVGWHSRLRAALILVAGFLPLLGWSSIVWWNTGDFTVGTSNFGLGRNLYLQVTRMASLGKVELDAPFDGPNTDLSSYAWFVWNNLATFVRFRVSETANLIFNPGTNYLLGDFFGLKIFNPVDGEGRAFWNSLRADVGLSSLLLVMLKQSLIWQVVFATMLAIWGMYIVLACIGAIEILRDKVVCWEEKAILLGYLFYTIIIVQVSISRPAHRSSADFIVVLLAGFGIRWILKRYRRGALGSSLGRSPPS